MLRKLLVFVLCWPVWVEAATKFIDLSGTGSGTADGSSVSNQCAGVGDADCIGANLPAGSTAYLCGAATSTITVPVAGSSGNVTVYDCSCPGGTAGSVSATSGQAWIENKAYTELKDCTGVTTANASGVIITASNVEIDGGSYTGGLAGVQISEGASRSNITIRDLTADSTAESGGDGVRLFLTDQSSLGRTFTDITIDGITVDGVSRSGVYMFISGDTPALATSTMSRVTIKNSTLINNGNVGITFRHTQFATPASPNEDLIVENNTLNGNTGGAAILGVGSSTSAYGKNYFRNNDCSNNVGVTGGLNIFASEYFEIYGNTCRDNSSPAGVDGNGILLDNDVANIRVLRNELSGNNTLGTGDNSGVGLMILTATNVLAASNVIFDNRYGVFISGAGTSSGIEIFNNTISGNSVANVYWADDNVETNATELAYNSLSDSPLCLLSGASSPEQDDHDNNLYCDTNADVNWTADESLTGNPLYTGGSSPTTADGFDTRKGSPLRSAGTIVEYMLDYDGRPFKSPPSIGAKEVNSGDEAEERALRYD